ncbi:hypothetical protein JYU34_015263 [Plutella xylostella]|uniref:Uncharacterized protein n=1 Tax=Plutella xylostella TaxID=51655 RepID=A0ABQ7Q843_PLUXY|nr:hypothetical protein JYU34_015263 [Plutella xylostella]
MSSQCDESTHCSVVALLSREQKMATDWWRAAGRARGERESAHLARDARERDS